MGTEHSVKALSQEVPEFFQWEGLFCTSLEVSHKARVDVCFLPVWRESMTTLFSPIRALAIYMLEREIPALRPPTKCPLILECIFSNDAGICTLNDRYRGKKMPTNVLSFSQEAFTQKNEISQTPLLLGSVILAYETVRREAEETNKSFSHHCLHLLLHGILHLVGFDHETALQAKKMEALERRILATTNIPDPYATC
jgi:rRNA maturation RNase YbeY